MFVFCFVFHCVLLLRLLFTWNSRRIRCYRSSNDLWLLYKWTEKSFRKHFHGSCIFFFHLLLRTTQSVSLKIHWQRCFFFFLALHCFAHSMKSIDFLPSSYNALDFEKKNKNLAFPSCPDVINRRVHKSFIDGKKWQCEKKGRTQLGESELCVCVREMKAPLLSSIPFHMEHKEKEIVIDVYISNTSL